jgi:hypothetical protein
MRAIIAALLLATLSVSAAANSLVAPGPVSGIAKGRLSAKPDGEWNRLSAREGKRVETWTIDGPLLNRVLFFGGIAPGQPLVQEADKKRAPLPKVANNMLMTDIPALLESTYRARGDVNRMVIETQEPTTLAGQKAVRFTYTFVRGEDDVQRRGEGIGTLKAGELFLVVYEAPALHFFDKDVEKFRQLVPTLSF